MNKGDIYKNHKIWLKYVMKLGANTTDAKEIVSQMYFKIIKKLNKGLNINYEDSFNHQYIIMTLKSLFLDKKRNDKKEILTLRIDRNGDVVAMNKEGKFLNVKPIKLRSSKDFDYYKLHKKLEKTLDNIQKKNNNLYFIDRHLEIFKDIYYNSDGNLTKYAKNKNLSYYQVYRGFSNIKKIIKKNFLNL